MATRREAVGAANLAHVLANACTDNDCELHHPEVGYDEEVVNLTDLAFFVAGAQAVANGEDIKTVIDRVTRGL